MNRLFIVFPTILLVACTSVQRPAAVSGKHAHYEVFPAAHYEPERYLHIAKGPLGYPFVPDPPPRILAVPTYPQALFERNIEGVADVAFAVDEAGHVVDAIVVQTDPEGSFGESAVAAIRRSIFGPPRRGWKDGRFESRYRYTFRIQREGANQSPEATPGQRPPSVPRPSSGAPQL